MTKDELNALFEKHAQTPAAFIAWAAGHGVTVSHSTVSRHRAGTQGITGPWEICYRVFFSDWSKIKDRLTLEGVAYFGRPDPEADN